MDKLSPEQLLWGIAVLSSIPVGEKLKRDNVTIERVTDSHYEVVVNTSPAIKEIQLDASVLFSSNPATD